MYSFQIRCGYYKTLFSVHNPTLLYFNNSWDLEVDIMLINEYYAVAAEHVHTHGER